ncbi:alpha/beta-hydrolase [Cryphonectria parasitica EP155]|uniref:Alpha/beta-hydrolase n=1 Tax=Cryphonectria parasitica (strain ATCC 38755 / EP155) TaxID=660469 RepID=A0A9P5CLZ8_CRYP1|nr:alpha/beta-hydrolase [Cryphonectria parasitica EP155]KAF3763608.1 alpha/beta-hydrolase [Cryphonectria parasitica EP155]
MKASSSGLKAGVAQALLATGSNAQYLYNQTIQTAYGPIQGVPALNSTCCSYINGYENVTVFRGIPFAANPGGENRFKAPQKAASWNETLVASEFGSGCPAGTAPYGGADPITDEDCLNLNIWTSASSTAEKRPVMIWSYPAGANNAWTMFDGSQMSLQDIVVVTYNYRAGPYGWLALPELYVESGNLTTGNYGILDQLYALQWVHDNIADFGGDPDRITTVGQSAGSAAVYHTLNNPLAKGLVVGAIAESGIRDPRDPQSRDLAEGYNNMSTSIELSYELMDYLNVTTLEELRQVSAADINEASTFTSFSNWRGCIDGYVFPATYWEDLQTGPPGNDVPVITGNTKDESGATYGLTATVAGYESTLNSTYGSLAADFLAAYPASNDTQAAMQENLIARDTSLIGTWNFANMWANSSTQPIYTYYWDHAPADNEEGSGAKHMSEINYIFNNLYGTQLSWTEVDYQIASTVNAYWANFIKTQNPNDGGSWTNGTTLGTWYASNSSSPATFHLSPAAPENLNGLPAGYEMVPVATDDHITLINEFLATQQSL